MKCLMSYLSKLHAFHLFGEYFIPVDKKKEYLSLIGLIFNHIWNFFWHHEDTWLTGTQVRNTRARWHWVSMEVNKPHKTSSKFNYSGKSLLKVMYSMGSTRLVLATWYYKTNLDLKEPFQCYEWTKVNPKQYSTRPKNIAFDEIKLSIMD